MSKKKKNSNWIYALIFIGVICLWSLCWYLVVININDNDSWPHRGQFGDMFGAVNALFSGLAFAGIIITILLQRDELGLQRIELELTRTELQLTRKEFKDQNDTLSIQRFENTFFNLLSLHNRLIEDAKGREFFDSLKDQLKDVFGGNGPISKEYLKDLSEKYNSVLDKSFINLFLESVCRMVDFINDSDLIYENEKPFYYSIIESSLSDSERIVIYYHTILSDRNERVIKKLLDVNAKDGFFTNLYVPFFDANHSELSPF